MKQTQFFNAFEVLFKDFMHNSPNNYAWDLTDSICNTKFNYPVDILESEHDGLIIEIAAVGADKEDIKINVENSDILRISYERKTLELSEEAQKKADDSYIQRGIARRSFNFGWKVSSKFDLELLQARLDKGLLRIEIPFSQKGSIKSIEIK